MHVRLITSPEKDLKLTSTELPGMKSTGIFVGKMMTQAPSSERFSTSPVYFESSEMSSALKPMVIRLEVLLSKSMVSFLLYKNKYNKTAGKVES